MPGDRERLRENVSSTDTEHRNMLTVRDPDEAREQLLSRLESEQPLVDIDESDSFEFSERLKSRFRDFL